MTGEETRLTFMCPGCKKRSQPSLKDFASGTIRCANSKTPHKVVIPDNDRYRRLAREIDRLKTDSEIVAGVVPVGTKPYLVIWKPKTSEVAVYHVQSLQTQQVAAGNWNGKGNALNWPAPVTGNIGVSVLTWLEFIAANKDTN